jgi:negative regulator of sigma E activity
MAEAADGSIDFESLLSDALRPIEPPEDLSTRVESTLSAITEHAAAELSSWAGELSEGELQALRDPRNWVRPVTAIAVGSAAAAGLAVVVGVRRRNRPPSSGLRGAAERLRRELGRD